MLPDIKNVLVGFDGNGGRETGDLMKVALAKTSVVKDFMGRLKAAGATVEYDPGAGTVVAHEGAVCVYRAIQKGSKGPWIVRVQNGDTIRWG